MDHPGYLWQNGSHLIVISRIKKRLNIETVHANVSIIENWGKCVLPESIPFCWSSRCLVMYTLLLYCLCWNWVEKWFGVALQYKFQSNWNKFGKCKSIIDCTWALCNVNTSLLWTFSAFCFWLHAKCCLKKNLNALYVFCFL